MMNTIRARAARLIAGVALLLAASVSSASAETLMMPKRDARMGVPVVVWGVAPSAPAVVGACTIDFGDSTPAGNCTGFDRSFIGFAHTYATQGTFTATLTVGAETATVAIQVFDPAAFPDGGAAGDNNRSLGINMAIQDGLRYLWVSQANRAANFPNVVTTNWGNSFPYADAALVVLAFENHGYKLPSNPSASPTGLYEKYIVRRGLNYVMSSLSSVTLTVQAAGTPCVGGVEAAPCVGYSAPGDPGYATAIAILPFAASGALTRTNTEAGGVAAGKTFGEILQRLVNAEAWGQTDNNGSNPGQRGGFGYNHNGGQFDGSTVGWAILAFLDAGAAGATVPSWVPTEFGFGFKGAHNNNGSFDYGGDNNPASDANVGMEKGGIPLQGLYWLGTTAPFPPASKGAATLTYLSNRWNSGRQGTDYDWSWSQGCPNTGYNKGCAYSMFNAFKGLKLQGVTTLPGVTRPAGPGLQPAGDWYADYQDWLVSNQTLPNNGTGGYWGGMKFSVVYGGNPITAAIAELILSPVALVLPDEVKFKNFGLTPSTASGLEGTTHTVTAKAESTGGTPVPGATVVFKVLSGPNAGLTSPGITTGATGEASFTYTDPIGNLGLDKIQAFIGSLGSNVVDMLWKPLNQPPVAVDDADSTWSGTPATINVIGNDSDPDSDPLTVTAVTQGTNGSVVNNGDGTVTYTPVLGFAGVDTFTYDISDGKGGTAQATVTVTVTKREATVTAGGGTKVYGDADPALTATTQTGFLAGDIAGITLASTRSAGQTVAAYATTATATGGNLANYNVTYVAGSFSITERPVTITAAAQTKHFGTPDPPFATAYTVTSGSLAFSDAFVGSLTRVAGEAVGSYAILQGSVALNANYALAYIGANLTITNTAPSCEAVAPSISLLWPPNHQLVPVGVNGVTDADGDSFAINVTRISQDELVGSASSGNTGPDGTGVGTSTARVRAERNGDPKTPGNGRVYHIFFTATDPAGGSCSAELKVGVPHDQSGKIQPIDNGALYDSTIAVPKK